jgi:cytochrome c peroxidase
MARLLLLAKWSANASLQGLPRLPGPYESRERAVLGLRLFNDPILSANDTVSCATCHKPQFGFADDKSLSQGAAGKTSSRNAPSLLNVADSTFLFWDGRASSLEEQIAGPIESPEEMANTIPAVEQRLNADPTYRQEFAKAWGPGPITFEMVEKSIASFERGLLSGNSSFDRWKYGHDEKAVSDSVKRGSAVFTSPKKGNCSVCHLVGEKYALFTDNKFHDIGVGVASGMISDAGRYAVTHDEADRGKFKTPSLRNIGLTSPSMQDGSLKDLKQVRDLLAFLNSLNGEMPQDGSPANPGQAKNRDLWARHAEAHVLFGLYLTDAYSS